LYFTIIYANDFTIYNINPPGTHSPNGGLHFMHEKTSDAMTFEKWFAGYLKQDLKQVELFLRDETATRFLIVWSLFESHCFDGFTQVKKFWAFSKRVTESPNFYGENFLETGKYFYSRYQNRQRYKNLMHKQTSKELDEILSKGFDNLNPCELVFFLLFVVYRFRNNIFHGNKGVQSWLHYKEQITLCLTIMQPLISFSLLSRPGDEQVFSPILNAMFVLIPDGTFIMGSPKQELDRDRDEKLHNVTISKPFYLQTTAVTQAQWQKVMKNNPSDFKNRGSNDNPVEQVSWDDVQEFIRILNRMEGTDKYRLPTEAQWEYAARAGTTTRFYTGNLEADLSWAGWYERNNGRRLIHPVGQKIANLWGLYDMHGNVWEWCQDWYGYYSDKNEIDPKGPSSGSKRVNRGGSWGNTAAQCRSAKRGKLESDRSSNVIGFRLLRTF
jgi:formylglycine-generating enzyme required for sulfatase activity